MKRVEEGGKKKGEGREKKRGEHDTKRRGNEKGQDGKVSSRGRTDDELFVANNETLPLLKTTCQ